MTLVRPDGTEHTIDVHGYRCEGVVTPPAEACPQHLDRHAWGRAA